MIVDDEADIREILSFNLSAAGYETLECETAEEALAQIRKGISPDLVLLDIMLPGMSGFKLADTLRKVDQCNVPIIFLTARSSENDLLTGFSAGGDDYICKPFSINEVIARVKAVLRRSSTPTEERKESSVVCGQITIDKSRKLVYAGENQVVLSKKEFEILSLLASNPGKLFSREKIIEELWKDAPYVLDRTVDVHIARIRSKLGEYKNHITNRSGYGYSFNEN